MQAFQNRLKKMARHYDKWARRQHLEAYRIYDADLEEHPLTIDRYGEQLYVSVYAARGQELTEAARDDLKLAYRDAIQETLALGKDQIFFKFRRKHDGSGSQYEKLSIAKREFTVVENELGFIVNLTDYLDTGLFPDHRQLRLRIAKEAAGKTVLNLFAYTGALSVYAAAGGAHRVESLDLSNTYLNWGKRNFQINKIPIADHRWTRADALAWLSEDPTATYDLAVLDPPAFSNSKTMREPLDLKRDHAFLINRTLGRLNPGGKLYFCAGNPNFRLDEGALVGATSVREITAQTLPPDYRKKNLHRCWELQTRETDPS